MTINEIVTLVNAGFTKDEIIKIAGIASPSDSSQAQAQEPEKALAASEPADKPEEKEAPENISAGIEAKFDKLFTNFENLYNHMAEKAQMPAIGNIEPKGIDDIINDFFNK